MIEHPAVTDVAVVGVPNKKWGEQVACFMRKAEGIDAPDPAEPKAHVRKQLSPQKTPAYWIWVNEFPLTGSGKIKKFAMAEAFANGEFS